MEFCENCHPGRFYLLLFLQRFQRHWLSWIWLRARLKLNLSDLTPEFQPQTQVASRPNHTETHNLRARPGAVRNGPNTATDTQREAGTTTVEQRCAGANTEASCAVGDELMTRRCGRPHPHPHPHTNHPTTRRTNPEGAQWVLQTQMSSCCIQDHYITFGQSGVLFTDCSCFFCAATPSHPCIWVIFFHKVKLFDFLWAVNLTTIVFFCHTVAPIQRCFNFCFLCNRVFLIFNSLKYKKPNLA